VNRKYDLQQDDAGQRRHSYTVGKKIRILGLRPLTAANHPTKGVNIHSVRRFNFEFEACAIVTVARKDLHAVGVHAIPVTWDAPTAIRSVQSSYGSLIGRSRDLRHEAPRNEWLSACNVYRGGCLHEVRSE
jgi:hypothetical protein